MTHHRLPRRTLRRAAFTGTAALLGGMYAFSQLSGKATPEEQAWRYPGDGREIGRASCRERV